MWSWQTTVEAGNKAGTAGAKNLNLSYKARTEADKCDECVPVYHCMF